MLLVLLLVLLLVRAAACTDALSRPQLPNIDELEQPPLGGEGGIGSLAASLDLDDSFGIRLLKNLPAVLCIP